MKYVEKGLNILVNIIFYLAIAALVFFAFGVRYYNVLSESMEPTIPVGSLIIVWPTNFDNLETNDVVTVRLENTGILLTHRAVELNHEEQTIITKGDNNPTRDPQPIAADQLVGRVVFHIPVLGSFISFLKTPTGITIVATVIIAYLVARRFVFTKPVSS